MKKLFLPLAAVILIVFFVNHFMTDENLKERVVLSKGTQAVVSEQAKIDKMGYVQRNIALNKSSELEERKTEFNFDNPCAKKELFVTKDGASFLSYKKQAYSVFDDTEMMAKLDASQEIIDKMQEKLEGMNYSNTNSKIALILPDIEKLVTMQNYFAQEILKKLPASNDFSYLIAQKTIEVKMANLIPFNVLIFCRGKNESGCDLIKEKMKKAVDSESLLFANNIDTNIYFNNSETHKLIESDKIVCKSDIDASKLALQNRFSSLYEQNMNDNLNSVKISPF